MSGMYPSTPVPNSLKITSYQPAYISTAHNLRRIRRTRGAHRWMIELGYKPLQRSEAAELFSFAMKREGQYDEFDVVPAILGVPQGNASGSPVVSSDQVAGQTMIPTSSWPATTQVFKAGDISRFGNHSKVYMVCNNAITDGAGAANLNIRPALVAAVPASTAIIYNDVPMQVTFMDDTLEMLLTPPVRIGFSVRLIETL